MAEPLTDRAPHPPRGEPSRRTFLGWRMVGVAFLCDFVAVGFFFYSYGVFFKALAQDFGGSRLGVSLGLTVANVVGALSAPALGRLLDRVSLRRMMSAGAVSVAIGFALISRIDAIWQFYLLIGTFVALGLNCLGGMASAKLVTNWFDLRRGAALGIATIGISLSGLVMPGVATWLIAHLGWRGAFVVYAIATLVLVLPVVAWGVVDRPEDVGQQPDGGARHLPAHPRALARAPDRVWRTREILAARSFWGISLCFALCFAALSAVLTHLVPHATDLGLTPYRAAALLSVAAGAGIVGKVVFGWLVDRVDARAAIGTSLGGQLLGVLLLLRGGDEWALFVAALVFGFGMGGVIPLQGAATGSAFGRLSFGKVSGLMRPVMVPLSATGVPLAGWIYDRSGSYETAFLVFVGLYLAAAAILLVTRIEPAASAPAATPAP